MRHLMPLLILALCALLSAVSAQAASISVDLSLTLADLSGVGEGVLHTLPDIAGNFDAVAARP